eukprot:4100391-Pleurochrysis_carterae.AAC.1
MAILTAIKREMTQQREWSSAPAATSTAILPATVMHAAGIAPSTPATTAESVEANTLIPAAASAIVANSSMFQATPPSDDRFSWPPEPIHVPPPPIPVLHELGRALRAAREEEESALLGGGERVVRRTIRGGPSQAL